MPIRPRDPLLSLPKTVHGGQAWKLGDVEDYSHNLNPFGPPEGMSEIVMSALSEVDHYPDDSSSELKDTIAKEFGVDTTNVTVGAGSSDIIRNFPNTFLSFGDKVLLNTPSFAEYGQQCRIAGIGIEYNQLLEEDDLYIREDAVSDALDRGVKAIYICNPNNPTGRVESKDKIERIVRLCKDHGAAVFLDETLLELVHGYKEKTCVNLVKKYDNIVVAGSLTKSFAIPGIRIGFGISCEENISNMEKVRMTWNVGAIEQKVATVLIRDHMDHVHKASEMMASESVRMNKALNSIGFPSGKVSDSFFYFNSLAQLGVTATGFKDALLKNGIMIRDCSSFGDRFTSYVRYSVKDTERNDRFIQAIEKTMKQMGC